MARASLFAGWFIILFINIAAWAVIVAAVGVVYRYMTDDIEVKPISVLVQGPLSKP